MAQGRKEALSVQALQFVDAVFVYFAFVIGALIRNPVRAMAQKIGIFEGGLMEDPGLTGLTPLLFVILPLSGWTLWSAIQPARPLSLLGLVPVPPMPFQDFSPELQYRVLDIAEDVHVGAVI